MRVDHDLVRQMAATGQFTDAQIATAVGCHPGYARLIRTGQVKRRSEGGSALSRKEPKTLNGKFTRGMPPFDHPALMDGRTLYPTTVKPVGLDRILKSGFNSAKIGARIMKGKWKGFPVFTLTLEERATCPTSCKHWRSCMGNGMPQARRYRHDAEFERALISEVIALGRQNPGGFVIRLHCLGDFFSIRYVQLWRVLLDTVPSLHCFGYSARNDDEIGKVLRSLVAAQWSRFAIRFSNAIYAVPATVSIEHPYQFPATAFLCPAQTGRTDSCSTCGACWATTKTVSFLQH